MPGVAGRITWDGVGDRFYETGVKNAVLYPITDAGAYDNGVAWNGIISITEQPSGAEANGLYADDTKYLNLISAEEFAASLECYTYPKAFAVLNGQVEIATGALIGQQARGIFGLCYKTTLGNDVKGDAYGYKLHLVYGLQATPSEMGYKSKSESPEALTFSFTLNSTPVTVTGKNPTSIVTINSKEVDPTKLAALEDILYGTDEITPETGDPIPATVPRMPLPNEIATLLAD